MADSELYAPADSFRENAYFKSVEEYQTEYDRSISDPELNPATYSCRFRSAHSRKIFFPGFYSADRVPPTTRLPKCSP